MFLGYIEIIMRLQHDADDGVCPDYDNCPANDEIGDATSRAPQCECNSGFDPFSFHPVCSAYSNTRLYRYVNKLDTQNARALLTKRCFWFALFLA